MRFQQFLFELGCFESFDLGFNHFTLVFCIYMHQVRKVYNWPFVWIKRTSLAGQLIPMRYIGYFKETFFIVMASPLIALTIGYLEISNASAIVLSITSILFLGSFVLVSIKNDNEGMMKWIFENKNKESW